MPNATLCIKCGKVRIIAKTWKEKVEGQVITYTQTVCPDPVCQSSVESELKIKMDRIKDIQRKSLERRKLNRRNKKPTKPS